MNYVKTEKQFMGEKNLYTADPLKTVMIKFAFIYKF